MSTQSQRTGLDKVLEEVVGRGTVTGPDGSLHALFPIAIPPREGEALSRWVAHEQAASSIETGFGYGISTLYIFSGLLSRSDANFRHVALDPNQITGFSSLGLRLVGEAGLTDRLEFHEEGSELALPRFVSQKREFDFAFIDGNHRFDGVFLDLIYLGRLLRGGSVIFLDDYQLPATRKAVSFCTGNLEWIIEESGVADETHHWIVLRTAQAARPRAFDYFVDFQHRQASTRSEEGSDERSHRGKRSRASTRRRASPLAERCDPRPLDDR